MSSKKIIACCKAIADKKWNIAFAESATGGRMCSEFSLAPNSDKIIRGGIFCPDSFAKQQILKVPSKVFEEFAAESAEVTALLARNTALFFNSKITVAVTGLIAASATPTQKKPLGTMFLHIIIPNGYIVHQEIFSGDTETIILKTIDKAAELLYHKLAPSKSILL